MKCHVLLILRWFKTTTKCTYTETKLGGRRVYLLSLTNTEKKKKKLRAGKLIYWRILNLNSKDKIQKISDSNRKKIYIFIFINLKMRFNISFYNEQDKNHSSSISTCDFTKRRAIFILDYTYQISK